MLNLQWPYKYNNNTLLYILQYDIDGPMNCTSDMEINPLRIKVMCLIATFIMMIFNAFLFKSMTEMHEIKYLFIFKDFFYLFEGEREIMSRGKGRRRSRLPAEQGS